MDVLILLAITTGSLTASVLGADRLTALYPPLALVWYVVLVGLAFFVIGRITLWFESHQRREF